MCATPILFLETFLLDILLLGTLRLVFTSDGVGLIVGYDLVKIKK